MFVLPSLRICSSASLLAPSPTASIAMTEPTPKTTPSIVRNDRSLWSSRAWSPCRIHGGWRRLMGVANPCSAGGGGGGAEGDAEDRQERPALVEQPGLESLADFTEVAEVHGACQFLLRPPPPEPPPPPESRRSPFDEFPPLLSRLPAPEEAPPVED